MILPGAYGAEMSIQYTNIMEIFRLWGFKRTERIVGLWTVNTYLTEYKRLSYEKLERDIKEKQKPAQKKI